MEPQTGFNMGRASEITRDEVKFFKFIERLQNKFSSLFLDVLKKQCILRGILTLDDWNKIYQDIVVVYSKDSYFTELKENEILKEKVDMLNTLGNYRGIFFSTKYIRKYILDQTEEDIARMDEEMAIENQQQIQQQLRMQQLGLVDEEEQK